VKRVLLVDYAIPKPTPSVDTHQSPPVILIVLNKFFIHSGLDKLVFCSLSSYFELIPRALYKNKHMVSANGSRR